MCYMLHVCLRFVYTDMYDTSLVFSVCVTPLLTRLN